MTLWSLGSSAAPCSLGRESISFQRAYEDASEKVRLLMGGDRAAGCFSIVVGQVHITRDHADD